MLGKRVNVDRVLVLSLFEKVGALAAQDALLGQVVIGSTIHLHQVRDWLGLHFVITLALLDFR